jgi:AraC-like DNA-binding protein
MPPLLGIAARGGIRHDCARLVDSCTSRPRLRKACLFLLRAARRADVHYTAAMVAVTRPNQLDRARSLALELAHADGHIALTPEACLLRCSHPTTLTKSATFGITLGVVLQGSKRIRVGEHELVVEPQRLVVVTRDAEMAVAVTSASPERPYLGFSLCFGPERVARALLALAEAGGPTTPETAPVFAAPIDTELADALARYLRALRDPLDEKLLAPLAVDEILYRLLRSDAAAAVRSAVGSASDAQRIVEAMRYIRANHQRKLDVSRVAREVAMSPSHFAHRFRAVARTSPMRYLREVRLERARSLLLESGARASDVALQVGFETHAHFTREFKRRFGAPPSHYLR